MAAAVRGVTFSVCACRFMAPGKTRCSRIESSAPCVPIRALKCAEFFSSHRLPRWHSPPAISRRVMLRPGAERRRHPVRRRGQCFPATVRIRSASPRRIRWARRRRRSISWLAGATCARFIGSGWQSTRCRLCSRTRGPEVEVHRGARLRFRLPRRKLFRRAPVFYPRSRGRRSSFAVRNAWLPKERRRLKPRAWSRRKDRSSRSRRATSRVSPVSPALRFPPRRRTRAAACRSWW